MNPTDDVNDTNDVEKRWRDPAALRSAMTYVVAVVVLAGLVFGVFALWARDSAVVASGVPGVLFVGAVGAFVKTYRDWRARRTWPIWQGAGWFLLALALAALSVPYAAALATV